MEKSKTQIFSDGGARGNPGSAAAAFVVIENGEIVYKESKFLGINTNNFAEYQGVIIALDWLSKNQKNVSSEVDFFMDSELVVKQINGVYKVKEVNLKKLNSEVRQKLGKISSKLFFQNIRREKNELADELVNETLDRELL